MARYSAGAKTTEEVPSLNSSVKVSVHSRSGEMPTLRQPMATPPQGVLAQAPETPVGGVNRLPLPVPAAPAAVRGGASETRSSLKEYSGSGLLEIAEASDSGLLRLNDSGSGLIKAADISVLPDDSFQRIDPPTTLPTIEGFYEALDD